MLKRRASVLPNVGERKCEYGGTVRNKEEHNHRSGVGKTMKKKQRYQLSGGKNENRG